MEVSNLPFKQRAPSMCSVPLKIGNVITRMNEKNQVYFSIQVGPLLIEAIHHLCGTQLSIFFSGNIPHVFDVVCQFTFFSVNDVQYIQGMIFFLNVSRDQSCPVEVFGVLFIIGVYKPKYWTQI